MVVKYFALAPVEQYKSYRFESEVRRDDDRASFWRFISVQIY